MPGGHPLLLGARRDCSPGALSNRLQIPAGAGRVARPPSFDLVLPHPLVPDLEHLASQVAADAGFQVCGIQLLTHRIPMTLQVQLRLADGGDVSLDNCAGFSGLLGEALESSGLLEEAYVLEISSPGISEELGDDRDFRSFRGFPVCVRHRDAKTGAETEREGLLLERNDTSVLINVRGRTVRFPRTDVISVRLTTPSEG